MNCKKTFRLLALVLVVASLLSFASCSKEKNKGDIVDEADDYVITDFNKVENVSKDSDLVTNYNSWFKNNAFENFSSAMKKTNIIADIFEGSPRTEEQKMSDLRELVASELKIALNAAYQYEGQKNYNKDIKSVSKVQKGVYKIVREKNGALENLELTLNGSVRAMKLVQADSAGNEIACAEFIVTSDGYTAWQRVGRIDKNSKWGAIKILFKANEGYYTREENLSEKPQSIYAQNCYEGFAGKK